MGRTNNALLAAGARQRLDSMKYEIASELGHFPSHITGEGDFRQVVDKMKFEIAGELGIPLSSGYNGDLTSREAGTIGGHIGGKIGGQMTKRLVAMAQEALANGQTL